MRLLVVEDEKDIAQLTRENLRRSGFTVDVAESLEDARAASAAVPYDLILLDLMLPDGDGVQLIRELRQRGANVPIIVVTARDAINDRVAGLNAGADDYLVKPYAMPELLARVRALMRRPGHALGARLMAGNVEFDAVGHTVLVGGAPLPLTRRELAVLEILMRRLDSVVTRDALDSAVYGFGEEIESNAIEAHVSRLRKRLSLAGADIVIHTVRGIGYMLSRPREAHSA